MAWYRTTTLITRAVITGSLLGLGFLQPLLWWCGWLGIGLTLFEFSFKKHTLTSAVMFGLLSWVVKGLLSIVWFWSTYPIAWLPVSFGNYELVVIAVYWITTALWLGCGGVIVSVSLYILSARSRWIVPVAWVVGELCGALVFAIATYGTGAQITFAFSFGFVGFLAAQHQYLLSFAQWGGVYLLTYIYVLIGYGGWLVWSRYQWPGGIGLGVGFLVLVVTAHPVLPIQATEPSEGFLVALVSTSLAKGAVQVSDIDRYRLFTQAIETAETAGAQYVILPEDSRWLSTTDAVALQLETIRFTTNIKDVTILDSARTEIPEYGTVLRGTMITLASSEVRQADKQYLVPQGEFMPVAYTWWLKWFGYDDVVLAVTEQLSYRPGPLGSQTNWSTSTPGVLFCFEGVDPQGVRRLVQDRPTVPFIVHPISHAWFHRPTIFWQQLDTMLRVQAVWNQTSIVSAGNMSPSKLYTPDGQITLPTVVAQDHLWSVGLVTVPLRDISQ